MFEAQFLLQNLQVGEAPFCHGSITLYKGVYNPMGKHYPGPVFDVKKILQNLSSTKEKNHAQRNSEEKKS